MHKRTYSWKCVSKGHMKIDGRRLQAADTLTDFGLITQKSSIDFDRYQIRIKATERGEKWVGENR
jgi:hypothetical protein